MSTSTYIQTGTSVRVYDSAVQTHDRLPLGTYTVRFSPLEGFSLQRADDLCTGDEKVYGGREAKVEKVFRTYAASERSLGVLMSGDKGMGKSLFLRMVAERAQAAGMPIVRVTEDTAGLADFVDTLGECVVVFDEFEKVFTGGGRDDENNRQNQFLSLFDGMSATKRLYCLSINEIRNVSSYLVNRPGRFHYHLRFDYPGPEQVREYLADQAPRASKATVAAVVAFSSKTNLNYDHLRAIAFEIENDPSASFRELIEDLNIKMVSGSIYSITATYADGSTLVGRDNFNLFAAADDARDVLNMSSPTRSLYAPFLLTDIVQDPSTGRLALPVSALIKAEMDEEDAKELPVRIELALVGQSTMSYGAL